MEALFLRKIFGWLKMGEMDGMVEIVPQFALSFGATYTWVGGGWVVGGQKAF